MTTACEPDAPCRATLEPVGQGVWLCRVHRVAEFDEDVGRGRRPRYFAVCTVVRDPAHTDAAEVKGFVVRDHRPLTPGEAVAQMSAMFEAFEAELWEVGIRRYRFERAGRNKTLTRVIRGPRRETTHARPTRTPDDDRPAAAPGPDRVPVAGG